ncbi:unnamed protein product [Adineta steineri]|uniref:NAD(P)(+)--arginine ADP-ribosyltransferase n=1 Tax=Adineta steineri TaxID=433720 RepID=A0A814QMR0_9BILA|nr:unnamed protein product [Adineta steineri]CAF1459346.1 unnamed protein product [Adineta steineri]
MNRFSDIDCSFKKLTPVYGFRSEKLVTVEKALEPIQSQIANLLYYIQIAKNHCHYPSEHGLTRDESASIYIYTMEWGEQSLYRLLNQALRNENRQLLKVWFPYLKLFDTALNKLPTVKEVVWRGITADIGKDFTKNQLITWWSISSCSLSVNVIKGFLGNKKNSTMFLIEALNGKKVSAYTEYESEDEIILRLGTEFRVKSNALDHPNGSYVVHLIEIDQENNHTSTLVSSTNQMQLTTNQISSKSKLNKWKQDAITVAGANGEGRRLDQLSGPLGIFIDKNKNIFIADFNNHRIVKWEYNAYEGQIVAGGKGEGDRMNQLRCPADVVVDQKNHSIIIADYGNKRVIQWMNQNQQILIDNIDCYGLAIDKHGFLYVSDCEKNEVRRWKMGEYHNEGIIVAGANGYGNQLDYPTFIFVDEEQSVYVTDWFNHRVMKWRKGAKEGIVVAGGNGEGRKLNQLSSPKEVIVDDLGQIYVADGGNDRVMRWCEGKEEGEIVVGENRRKNEEKQIGWLNACVAVERAVLIFKGVQFDKTKSKYIARRIILILPFCILGTLIHELTFRRLFEYETAPDTNVAMVNNKTQCFTCNQDKITYLCEGCLKNFCLMDLTKHRQILNEELHHIINDYDQFKQIFNEQKPNSDDLALINQINEWEINSIKKIQLKARDCREIVIKSSQIFLNDIEKKFNDLSEQIKQIRQENEFNEINLNHFRNQLKKMILEINNPPKTSIQYDSQPFINDISIISTKEPKFNKWKQNAITVAGGNEFGQKLNQFKCPYGIFIDEYKNIFIADYNNHRIVEWKCNEKEGQIIAGGNKQGSRMNQLNYPTNVIVDQQNHSIIIADQGNRRVIQWLNQNQQILINNIDCFGLAMDKHGFLYISDYKKNEVRRWKMGEYNNDGIVVAGGYGQGNKLNQLNSPGCIFVDEEQTVYVSDQNNDRVMKWGKDAKEGTIAAGGNGKGGNLNQLSYPRGVIVDDLGQIYVADMWNHRVIRWCEGKEEGEIVVGGNGKGFMANQLNNPFGLSFDNEGNLHVVDCGNARIQKFEIIL